MMSWCDSCEQKVSSTDTAEPSDGDQDLQEGQ